MPVEYGYPTEEDKAKWPEIERLANIEERKRQIMAEIKHLEEGYNYSKMSGDMYNDKISWADKKLAEWRLLKEELRAL